RHAGHFRSEAVELVDHRVDGVLELENLAFHVDGDLLRHCAAGARGCYLGDVAYLAGQVGRHRVDVLGQVGPDARDAGHLRLSAVPYTTLFRARHAGHFRGETVELVDHRVDGVLELENLAFHV